MKLNAGNFKEALRQLEDRKVQWNAEEHTNGRQGNVLQATLTYNGKVVATYDRGELTVVEQTTVPTSPEEKTIQLVHRLAVLAGMPGDAVGFLALAGVKSSKAGGKMKRLLSKLHLRHEDMTALHCSKADLLEREAFDRAREALGAVNHQSNGVWTNQTDANNCSQGSQTEAAKVAKADHQQHQLFGKPVASVLRWMGEDAWTFEDARKALDKLGASVSDDSIRSQLLAGRKGTGGDPAKLTKDQEEKLYAAVE